MNEIFASGTQIGRFTIQAEVGRGGMGVVYRAEDAALQRPVALKFLASHLNQDRQALHRFHQEAATVANLKHNNIALMYEFGEYEELPYLAMEWIEGRTLKQFLQAEGPLSVDRALPLVVQIASALDYAHQRGLVHRDLKPSNIIVSDTGVITLIDFGLSWLESSTSDTATGSLIGTPTYMAPEQIDGSPVDGRADLYSLATIVYEMLAGQPPFAATNVMAVLHQKIYQPPTPISEVHPTIDPSLEAPIMKGLTRNPDDRFPTGEAFTTALQAAIQTAQPPLTTISSPVAPQSSRTWWVVGGVFGGAIMALLLLAVVAATLLLGSGFDLAALGTAPTPTSIPTSAIALTEQSRWLLPAGGSLHTNFVETSLDSELDPEPSWATAVTAVEPTQLVGLDSLVVWGDEPGQLQALDGRTGQPLWTRTLGSPIFASPAISLEERARLFVSTEQGLYGLDLMTGETLWHLNNSQIEGVFAGGITLFESEIIYGATDTGWLYRIEGATGAIDLAIAIDEENLFFQPPTLIDDQLFLVGESETIYRIDVATERLLWERPLFQPPSTPAVIVPEFELVVVGTEAQSIVAYSFEGERLWEEESPIFPHQLTVDWEGRLFVTDQEQGLLAFDLDTREALWEYETGEAEVTVGPFATDTLLFYGNSVGDIVFLDSSEGTEVAYLPGISESPIVSMMPLNNTLIVLNETQLYRLESLQR
ncbi:MAG: serine/threonine-protein kinase [Chloroflexota bacterium]